MGEDGGKSLLDRAVGLAAQLLDAVGLNGSRLRWKWNRRKLRLSETGAQASVFMRSATAKHKMCPSCRALVARSAASCPECGTGLARVRAPGVGRLLANVFPGATATTSLLLLVNGVLFLLMLMDAFRGGRGVGLFSSFGGEIFMKYGAVWNVAVFDFGQWWRLATAMFLHGGLLHFGFNSYVLLNLGPLVENEYGTERFWLVYLASGFFGNLVHVVLSPYPVVGASGAICGMVGLLLAFGSRVRTGSALMLRSAMVRFSVMILVISLLPGVSWQAHLGGFLTGLGLGWILPTGQFRGKETQTAWQLLALAGVLLVLFCFYRLARPA